MDALVLEDVSGGYGTRPVLKGVSFRVGAGEFVGVIGPNGSGKSTLVRGISRILPVLSGRVFLEGSDAAGMTRREIARRLAVVPQTQPLFYDFTVDEVVRMGRTPHLGRFQLAGATDREACRRAMEATEVYHLRGRSLAALSGGERQRALIARALAQQPRLLLLDEPDAHLDINHKVEVFDLLAELNRSEGLTVVCISHDLNLAALYARRIILLTEGQVAADDTPEAILTEPILRRTYGVETVVRPHPVTGRPQVNLLPGAHRTGPGRREEQEQKR